MIDEGGNGKEYIAYRQADNDGNAGKYDEIPVRSKIKTGVDDIEVFVPADYLRIGNYRNERPYGTDAD
jgi:hypothetical protein